VGETFDHGRSCRVEVRQGPARRGTRVRVLLTSFGVIFLAELPDKTALATLLLAARYRARPVVLGAWLAFLVQTVVAVGAGGLLHLLPERGVRTAAGVGLLVFAVLAWRRREAEWGDLTQFATAALAAQERDPLAVGVGAIAALWGVCVIAGAVGAQAGRVLNERTLARERDRLRGHRVSGTRGRASRVGGIEPRHLLASRYGALTMARSRAASAHG
jgi:putative Ca2+/H+ antiporter (TMEM165/GDT1 family)